MISTSKIPGPKVPPWLEGTPNAPKFFLRAGDVIERGLMEAELEGKYRAGRVNPFELIGAIRDGINTLMADDPERDAALELINAEAQGEFESLPPADQQSLKEIRDILAKLWPPYRDLLEQAARRREVAPLVAFRRFCTGVEVEGVEFKIGRDGLVENETLAAINPIMLTWAGTEAFALQYGGGQEKNSLPPSKSDDPPRHSQEGGTSQGAGSSPAGKKKRTGKKTPGSRSRRGSGQSSTSGSLPGGTQTL